MSEEQGNAQTPGAAALICRKAGRLPSALPSHTKPHLHLLGSPSHYIAAGRHGSIPIGHQVGCGKGGAAQHAPRAAPRVHRNGIQRIINLRSSGRQAGNQAIKQASKQAGGQDGWAMVGCTMLAAGAARCGAACLPHGPSGTAQPEQQQRTLSLCRMSLLAP